MATVRQANDSNTQIPTAVKNVETKIIDIFDITSEPERKEGNRGGGNKRGWEVRCNGSWN